MEGGAGPNGLVMELAWRMVQQRGGGRDDRKPARVAGKEGILFKLAEAAIEHPDEAVRRALYPIVGKGRCATCCARRRRTRPHSGAECERCSAPRTPAATAACCPSCWPPSGSVATTPPTGR